MAFALFASTICSLPLSLVLQNAGQPDPSQPEVLSRLRLAPETVAGLTPGLVGELDLDVIRAEPGGALWILAKAEGRTRLSNAGIPFEVIHEDAQRFYAERLAGEAGPLPTLGAASFGAWLNPPFGQGSMGGYYTFDELLSVFDQITAAYPDLVAPRTSIGQSREGRDLWAIQLTDQPGVDEGEPKVRFDSLHHAREAMSVHTALWFLLWAVESYATDPLATHLVDDREVWFVPVVNPDGYVYNQQIAPGGGGLWRKNRRNNGGGVFGVDLNRNYPFQWNFDSVGSSGDPASELYRGTAPASEPETQAMVAFMNAQRFDTALSIHTFSNLWLQPFGYDFVFPANQAEYQEVGDLAVEVNNYELGTPPFILTIANGVTIDYDQAEFGTMAWTPEIGSALDGFWPVASRIVPLAEENLQALQRTAQAAGAYVRVIGEEPLEVGDGDGFLAAGESVEFAVELRNSGRSAATPVSVTLTTDSPAATVTGGTFALASLGSFQSASSSSGELSLFLDPSAVSGTEIPYTLTLAYEGFVSVAEGRLVVGVPRAYLADSLELDLGWTAGVSGDTASTGQWELGDPIGTQSNGEDASPEDDDTPGVGQLCFTTGNGGGTGGTDDVDGGFTTLISPRFDLSDAAAATLSYSRWFADLSVADDEFQVSISNDDGATWIPLESIVGNQNFWQRSEFLVSEVIVPTDRMRLRFVASDDPNNSIVEAAIDELRVDSFDEAPRVHVYGDPVIGTPVSFQVAAEANSSFVLYWSGGTSLLSIPGVAGTLELDPSQSGSLFAGSIPSGGLSETVITLPNNTGLIGQGLYLQALSVASSGLAFSNAALVTFE